MLLAGGNVQLVKSTSALPPTGNASRSARRRAPTPASQTSASTCSTASSFWKAACVSTRACATTTSASRLTTNSSGVFRLARRGSLATETHLAYTPSEHVPATVYFNYGRGINSQDARGVVRGAIRELPTPDRPTPVQAAGAGVGSPIATTDFYQVGASHNARRFSLSTDLFLIDHSHEQVYIPDDGTTEFAGPSRAYGYELKSSVQITRRLALSGGVTRVLNAFFRGTHPRVYVDSSPHTVSNGGVSSDFHALTSRLCRLSATTGSGQFAAILASGWSVDDLEQTPLGW